MTVILTLPWPKPALWQNTRGHFMARARAVKAARHDTAIYAMSCGLRKGVYQSARIRWDFIPPNRVKRDVSNIIGALKAHIDGIADALGVDDATFRHVWPEVLSEPQPGGAIIAHVDARWMAA
jgi:crossover junction endodeoxyribonuclease RusA